MRENFVAPIRIMALFFMISCGSDTAEAPQNEDISSYDGPETSELSAQAQQEAQQAFWENLALHCGKAYEGSLGKATEGFDLLEGDERVVVHFRSCSDFEMRLPFHIEQETGSSDRSRTWVFFNHGDSGLELRHDHREPDGREEEETWYGGHAIEGGENWQRFEYPPRTRELGMFMGWRVEIHPGNRFLYGTMRGEEWTFRVDFDLTRPVDPPPPPWGFE